MLDNLSKRQQQLLEMQKTEKFTQASLVRAREKMITIEKNNQITKYTLHDVNFGNIDDWDVFKNGLSDAASLESAPLNLDCGETSIQEMLASRRDASKKTLTLIQRN